MKFDIHLPPIVHRPDTRVLIDGVDVTGDISTLVIRAGVNEVTSVTVTYVVRDGEVDVSGVGDLIDGDSI